MGALKHTFHPDAVTMIVVDLFCGGGGVSEGFHQARNRFGDSVAYVAAAVNHSPIAIESHAANHPETLHLQEDIWLANVDEIAAAVRRAQMRFPRAVTVVWMSAECTHYSKAKGGESRDAKSRTLPESIFRYLDAIQPDYLYVENVEEFMSWGPLVPKVVRFKSGIGDHCPLKLFRAKKGKKALTEIIKEYEIKIPTNPVGVMLPVLVPESRTKGRYYMKWVRDIKACGYAYDWQVLNCANFGCHTSRERYFGIFAKNGLPIRFPEPTHSKNAGQNGGGLFECHLKKWLPVRDVLDLSDQGKSIFERDTPLVEATLARIYAGLEKFVGKGEAAFVSKYFSGDPGSKNYSLGEPAHTVTCKPHDAVVFLQSYYGNGSTTDVNEPSPTVTTHDRFGVVSAHWLDRNFTGGGQVQSVNAPAGALLTIPKMNLVTAERRAPFIMDTQYGNGCQSIDQPARTITADRHWQYLLNPQFKNNGHSIEKPCPTLIARQDKRPMQVVTVATGTTDHSQPQPGDSPMMLKIREFMAAHGITDIKMRMLKVLELKLITGFPSDYILKGSKAAQKEMIGNAVPVGMARAFAEALDGVVCELLKLEAA